jgi:hypothetical protein
MEFKSENNEIVVDEEKLRKLQYRVFSLERSNEKTSEKEKLKDNQVVDTIIKMIAQEVDNVN